MKLTDNCDHDPDAKFEVCPGECEEPKFYYHRVNGRFYNLACYNICRSFRCKCGNKDHVPGYDSVVLVKCDRCECVYKQRCVEMPHLFQGYVYFGRDEGIKR